MKHQDERDKLLKSENDLRSLSNFAGDLVDTLVNELSTVQESDKDRQENTELRLALLKEIQTLLDAVLSIQDTRTEHKNFCIGCISEFLKRSVNRNAIQLKQFNEGTSCEFTFEPTAAALSSVPLSEHMKRLSSGDRYDVVSDLASWRDNQLAKFAKQTKLAVKEGVKVRRIFNLMLRHRFRPVTPKEMRMILEQHLADSESWNREYPGRYEVAIFGKPNLASLENSDPAIAHHQFGITSHFGIFVPKREGRTLVEYEVTEPNVSIMILKKDAMQIRRHLKTFEVVWNIAPKLGEKFGSKTVIQTVLENPKKWTG